MATRTREQYLKAERFPETPQVVKQLKRTAERTQERKAGLAHSITNEIGRGFLDLQLFLSSFLPPYGVVSRHAKNLSPKEKAEREMDFLVF